ncbi:MAG: type IV secretory system conjugative DNA transfer family protein [Terriglobales bacterium]
MPAVTDLDEASRRIEIAMNRYFEQLIASIWNRLRQRGARARNNGGGIGLGFRVVDGQVTRYSERLSTRRRTMHLAVIGKTGTGKSTFLRHLIQQDIEAGRGFLAFDLHGELMPFLLRVMSSLERRHRQHLSDRLIIIDPADPVVSVGLNPLEQTSPDFIRIAEFAEVLRHRWALDHFGARTDELLRNALYVLSACRLTLLELAPLLSNAAFRMSCLRQVENAEVRGYFEMRYGQVSDAMRSAMSEPVLNKLSAFTSDPRFRHLLGQPTSTFSLREAMDKGLWVIVNLNKGQLGEHALTLGSLIFTMLKNAIFSRQERTLFTAYCDELQNFVAFGSGIETVLSEARKFAVAIVSANQFLDQFRPDMRAAILSVGTHAFFQLSPSDAVQVAQALDGGKSLAERLKNLPQRHAMVKSGADRTVEIRVPHVAEPRADYTDLLNRTRGLWGTSRVVIEREIADRQKLSRKVNEVLDEHER